MGYEITDYKITFDIDEKLKNNILLLPCDLKKEFNGEKNILYTESSISVLKILRKQNISAEFAVGTPADSIYIENRSIDWFGPALFFSISVLSQNPMLVSSCINIISSYVYDIFKGKSEDPNVRCSFVLEDKDKNKNRHIKYEGPVSGLKNIEEILNGK